MKILLVLALVGLLGLAGCDAYLPADMRLALDQRVIELEADIEDADAGCKTMLQQDLDLLISIQGAVQ